MGLLVIILFFLILVDIGYIQLGGSTVQHREFGEQLSQNSNKGNHDHQTKTDTVGTEQSGVTDSKALAKDHVISPLHSESINKRQEQYRNPSNPRQNSSATSNQVAEVS